MSTSPSNNEQREKDCGCHPHECVETTYKTQLTVNTERKKYCESVYELAGEVHKWEKSYDGEKSLFNRKKCMLIWTQDNHQRYRNTEITYGTELVQTTEMIKASVKNYNDWSIKLSSLLKDIFKGVKDAKSKLGDLRQAACALEQKKTDACYKTEWTALLNKSPEPCPCEKENNNSSQHQQQQYQSQSTDTGKKYPDKCKHIDDTICDMMCMTSALDKDINYIFKSSSEIVGIQIFSNIATLDPLQDALGKKAKEFDDFLKAAIKSREGDMKTIQESFVKSVQATAIAAGSLYGSRSSFEAMKYTTRYFCCPKCKCVSKTQDDCEPHLKDCQEDICNICGHVQKTFCNSRDCKEETLED